jgi:hypothetical protein
MEQQSQPLSGSDSIRSLKNDDAIYRAFDAYPWKKDPAFMSGLQAILGDPSTGTPLDSLRDMAVHARIFYYSQRIGTTIDFTNYQSWLAGQTNHDAPDVLPEEFRASADSEKPTPLPWQQAAPKAELYVDKKAAAAQAGSAGSPNYPMAFAEMLKLLQEGKPIPGIRQIPNTIARDPSVKPVGTRTAPRKPWEKNVPAAGAAPGSTTQHAETLDLEFPPVESQETSAS